MRDIFKILGLDFDFDFHHDPDIYIFWGVIMIEDFCSLWVDHAIFFFFVNCDFELEFKRGVFEPFAPHFCFFHVREVISCMSAKYYVFQEVPLIQEMCAIIVVILKM